MFLASKLSCSETLNLQQMDGTISKEHPRELSANESSRGFLNRFFLSFVLTVRKFSPPVILLVKSEPGHQDKCTANRELKILQSLMKTTSASKLRWILN